MMHRAKKNGLLCGRGAAGLLLVLCVAWPTLAHGDGELEDRTESWNVDRAREDVAILRQALEEVHAGLDRHGGRAEMTAALDRLAVKPPTTVSAFAWEVARATAAIRDGHTRVSWPRDYIQRRLEEPLWMPLGFSSSGGRLWVSAARDELSSLIGAEVLAIDGRPLPEIRRHVAEVVAADAGLASAVDWALQEPGRLSFLLGERFGRRQSWEFLLRSPDGLRVWHTEVAGVYGRDMPAPPSAMDAPWNLTIDEGVAVLKIRHFVPFFYRRAGLQWESLLEESFNKISNEARVLVLDLRGNRGGSEDFVRDLLRHLLDEPFGYYRVAELRRRQVPYLAGLLPDLDWPSPESLQPGPGGGWVLPEEIACHGVYEPVERPFPGPVLALTDAGTFSAAAELASLLRSRRRAVLAGATPSGAWSGNTSGLVAEIELPNSKVRVRIPAASFFLDTETQPGGSESIDPDFPLELSGEDISLARDSALAFALAWGHNMGRS